MFLEDFCRFLVRPRQIDIQRRTDRREIDIPRRTDRRQTDIQRRTDRQKTDIQSRKDRQQTDRRNQKYKQTTDIIGKDSYRRLNRRYIEQTDYMQKNMICSKYLMRKVYI